MIQNNNKKEKNVSKNCLQKQRTNKFRRLPRKNKLAYTITLIFGIHQWRGNRIKNIFFVKQKLLAKLADSSSWTPNSYAPISNWRLICRPNSENASTEKVFTLFSIGTRVRLVKFQLVKLEGGGHFARVKITVDSRFAKWIFVQFYIELAMFKNC